MEKFLSSLPRGRVKLHKQRESDKSKAFNSGLGEGEEVFVLLYSLKEAPGGTASLLKRQLRIIKFFSKSKQKE